MEQERATIIKTQDSGTAWYAGKSIVTVKFNFRSLAFRVQKPLVIRQRQNADQLAIISNIVQGSVSRENTKQS
jgi:hypothetical protein